MYTLDRSKAAVHVDWERLRNQSDIYATIQHQIIRKICKHDIANQTVPAKASLCCSLLPLLHIEK